MSMQFLDSMPDRGLRVGMVSTQVPRQCGLATFSEDLSSVIAGGRCGVRVDGIAMSDQTGYEYPGSVAFEVLDQDERAYGKAADFVNKGGYDVLSIQHEYGIFGGSAGSHLLQLVRKSKVPIVTTLHTVLEDPDTDQRRVMGELLDLSERVVVMSEKAVSLLKDVHDLDAEKVSLIPHGIPRIDSEKGCELRESLRISGPMILTFGLLSPGKGLEHAIQAMPGIVEENPGATYVIVGATHPHVKAERGEEYRQSLVSLAEELGVRENVRFVNRFVTKQELKRFLAAMDYYVSPYLSKKQITSGTLAYALGTGKPVISTPYWHAEELLDEGRGVLVPFAESAPIADAINRLERDAEARKTMGDKALAYADRMYWDAVGEQYCECFAQAKRKGRVQVPVIVEQTIPVQLRESPRPEINCSHLLDLSDDTGIYQHANYSVPNRDEGYCIDDNARALLLTALFERSGPLPSELDRLQSRYLSFVAHAFHGETGWFRNFMGFDRSWLEERGSDDSHARALWGLGTLVRFGQSDSRRVLAKELFMRAVPVVREMSSPRAWGFALLGAEEFMQVFPHEYGVRSMMEEQADRLWSLLKRNRKKDWPWFEDILSYGNARLPQALLLSGEMLERDEMSDDALESLRWLKDVQTGPCGVFAPIGSNGFYVRGGSRNFFDQQPIEAWSSVSAYLTAAQVTGSMDWREEAETAFRWFLGDNMTGKPLYDPATGGCCDGLHVRRVNCNQGAESTLAYLTSATELRLAMQEAPATQFKLIS